uniref:valine--tRNA ligase n=1 Tax=Globodera pallida TaxID=36090 RepID=A0A183BKD3_GLOPA
MKILRLRHCFHFQCQHHVCGLKTISSLGSYDATAIQLVQQHYEAAMASPAHRHDTLASSSTDVFRMVLPPPNVTGNLHIGHAITVALEDTICRYQRLLGKKVLWTPGFDHAGMATQQVVEKQLERRFGKRRDELSQAEFVAYCEHWKEERIRDITGQLGSMACSLDWPSLFYTMDQKFARAVRVAFCRLHSRGLIVREARPVFTAVALGDTKKAPEAVIKEQWFLHMDGMNERLRSDLDAGEFNFTPPMSKEIADEFIKFKEPWNLSRQIVWGHRIPAYFVEKSERWIVAESEAEARAQLESSETDSALLQDPDVLDTWFSSALIPIVVAGWPDQPISGQSLELMETGYDIVGHWVAKMMMLGHCLTGEYPFTRVLLHGMVRDNRERKMSKSLGNVVDPLDVINGVDLQQMIERMRSSNLPLEEMALAEKELRTRFPCGMRRNGVDAFRFALLQHDLTKAVLRVDFTLPLTDARRFCKRVWNMCKIAQRVFEAASASSDCGDAHQTVEAAFEVEDFELRRQLALTTRRYHRHMQLLNTDQALHALREFIGDHVNSAYLEQVKCVLQAKHVDVHRLRAVSDTLREVVAASLGLLEPFLPQLCTFLQDTLALDAHSAAVRALREAISATDVDDDLTSEEQQKISIV